ncbi:cyclase family protein [Chlorobium sp. N1]|uniref:cyclase family protein n=1 Tax=Chlorobium sp. N1 TaxID=2491138 RepID=UPI0010398DA3|nr:cyclase family protein [Chlorobium sp. N1]TCD48152.1 cyclase family protein [Chlorobium sp. N1]
MRIHDLSHTLTENMPVWPGSPETRIRDAAGYGREGYLEREYSLSSHAGTHVDLARHMTAAGRPLEEYGPGAFIGSGRLLDLRPEPDGRISAAGVSGALASAGTVDFLLIHTGWSRRWGDPSYFGSFPFLDPDAARLLLPACRKGIGIDSPSVDAPHSEGYPVHHILLGHGLVIVENLTNLLPLAGRRFLFSALPLRIEGGEASPVRAVGIEDEGAGL